MIQLYRRNIRIRTNIITQQKGIVNRNDGKDLKMTLAQKKWILILAIAVVAFLLGRLAVRAFMNLLMGGTLFGGNFL